jgi:hypothetical protein
MFGMTKSEDWAAEQAQRIAATVRKLRGKRSGLWLSDETAKAGHRISRTSISELESGKRKSVTTAELCLLAWALKVAPIRLLYPDLPDGPVEVVPGVTVPSIKAAKWFSGEARPSGPEQKPLGIDGDDDQRVEEVHQVANIDRGDQLVALARERAWLEQRIRSLAGLVRQLKSENSSGADELVEDIIGAVSRIETINEQLQQIDGAVVTRETTEAVVEKELS